MSKQSVISMLVTTASRLKKSFRINGKATDGTVDVNIQAIESSIIANVKPSDIVSFTTGNVKGLSSFVVDGYQLLPSVFTVTTPSDLIVLDNHVGTITAILIDSVTKRMFNLHGSVSSNTWTMVSELSTRTELATVVAQGVDRLKVPFDVTITGDGTASDITDGSVSVDLNLVLNDIYKGIVTSGTSDPNLTTSHILHTTHVNAPTPTDGWMILTYQTGNDRSQIAISSGGGILGMACRHSTAGVYSKPWTWLSNNRLTAADIPALDASKITTGVLAVNRIPNLDSAKITTGVLSPDRIPGLDASKIISGLLSPLRIPLISADSVPGLDASKIITGTLNTDRLPIIPVNKIPSLDTSKITTGVFDLDRIPLLTPDHIPFLDASKISTGVLAAARIPALDTSKITTGILSVDRLPTIPVAKIPALDTSKITTGVFDILRIPNIDTSKITTGILHLDRIPVLTAVKIPSLDTSKITTGTLSIDRLPIIPVAKIPALDTSKVTTGVFDLDRIPVIPTSNITGLKAAAFRDVGTGVNQVMEVGAGGILQTQDLREETSIQGTPSTYWGKGTTFGLTDSLSIGMGGTASNLGVVMVNSHSETASDGAGAASKLFLGTNQILYSYQTSATTWSPTLSLFHTGNLESTVGNSAYKVMSQKAVTDTINSLDASKVISGVFDVARIPQLTQSTTGNAGSATKLATARLINGTLFDGTGNITTSAWGTARKVTYTGDVSGTLTMDGSANASVTLTVPVSSVITKSGDLTTVNLNTVLEPGFYNCVSDTAAKLVNNYPVANAGSLTVTRVNPTTVVQTYSSHSATTSEIYVRSYTGTVWTTWKTQINHENISVLMPEISATKITSGVLSPDRIPTLNQNTTGSAATLTTTRSISMTGDGTWTTSFNGSSNVTGAMTLANTGVTAGTYTKVTVDSKGRVNAATILVAADIPNLDASKITSGVLSKSRLPAMVTGDIPVLDASKITTGVFDLDRIPLLTEIKIPVLSESKVPLSGSATKLATSRLINGTAFDGTVDINTTRWGVARTLSYSGDSSGTGSVNGAGNVNFTLTAKPATIPSRAIALTDGDLDTIVEPGFYYNPSNANSTVIRNYPVQQAGTLEVFTSAGVTQRYTTYGSAGSEVYVRGKYTIEWTPWKRLVNDSNLMSILPALDASKITTGVLDAARIPLLPVAKIPDLDTAKITSGIFDLARIPNIPVSKLPDLDVAQITTGIFPLARIPVMSPAKIPALDTSKITTGIFDILRIPDLDAAKITTGVLSLDRIPAMSVAKVPDLDAAKITSGIFDLARIPTLTALKIPVLDASKIGTGIFDVLRIPDLDVSKITTGIFDAARIPVLNQNTTGNAASATKLATARNISITGDASWITSFNGTTNVTGVLTLTPSGVDLGTYTKVTVDAKGRVTTGATLVAADVPPLDATKVTTGVFLETQIPVLTVAKIPSLDAGKITTGIIDPARLPTLNQSTTGTASALTTARNIYMTGDGTWSTLFKGNTDVTGVMTLSNSGVVAGVYTKLTVDAKGRVTNGAVLSALDIPVLDTSKITSGILAVARIPALDTAKITTGVFDVLRIPDLDASKITTGVLAAARIPLLNQSTTGNSATATKLSTARSISITGDATWTTTFDGSSNATGVMSLTDSGVDFGTYTKVTVDAKGRVTEGGVLIDTDIPDLDASKITTGVFLETQVPALSVAKIPALDASKITTGVLDAARIPALNQSTTGTAAALTTARSISMSGDGTWSTTFNGSANVTGTMTLTASGVTAGDYTKVTVDAKGRVTGGSTLVAADIPVLDASKITTGVLNILRIPALDAAKVTTGIFDVLRIPALDAAKVTTGTFAEARIPLLTAAKIPALDAGKVTTGVFDKDRIPALVALDIPNLDAAKITTGTLSVDRLPVIPVAKIPALDVAKITTGIFPLARIPVMDVTRIPALDTAKITTGIFNVLRIPDLDASKITSGVIDIARLPALNQSTTGNAGSATKLLTARLIGGVPFDGTVDIVLPGVNSIGNQDTSGTAAKATILATARTIKIGDTSKTFNGAANIAWTLGEIGAAPVSHSHPMTDITGLNLALDAKAPTVHNHTMEQVTGLTASLDLKMDLSLKGANGGVASLDSGGKIPLSQLNDSVLGQVQYQGIYNAATNVPVLVSPTTIATKGHYYVVSTNGDRFGTDFEIGDWIISDGTKWDKVDNTDAVTSVAGRIGAILLTKMDVGLSNVQNVDTTNASNLTSGTIPAARVPVLNQSTTGSAASLTTARSISITGDATWTTSFNGTANATGVLALTASGVGAGAYTKVTVDTKGRVTAGATLVAADVPTLTAAHIPALDASKITTGVLAAARIPTLNQPTTGNAATATALATARSISMTGDGTWTTSFNGTANATGAMSLSNTGVVAGTHGDAITIPIVTVDLKGRLSSLSSIAIRAASISASGIVQLNNTLTSTSATLALTAAQGKVLQDNKVDKVAGKELSTNDFTTLLLNKLNDIATGATKNETDAALRARASHTGVQAISTITGLQAAIDTKVNRTGDSVTGRYRINTTDDTKNDLQVGGDSSLLGAVGFGNNNPTHAVDVSGSVRVRDDNAVKFGGTGSVDNAFAIQYNPATNSLDFNFTGS